MLTFVIRNTFLTLTATIALAVAGLWAWRHVPVDAIPDLSDNQVIVWAEWPGKSPQDLDDQVTSRLARELQGLPGVQTVRANIGTEFPLRGYLPITLSIAGQTSNRLFILFR